VGTEYFEKNILTYADKPLPWIERESDFLLKCLEYEKIPIPSEKNACYELSLSFEEKEAAEAWLMEKCGADKKRELIAVAPGSKWSSKIWPEERFAEVIQGLIEKRGVFPIIFGGAEDREKGERLIKIWKTGANAAGELNVRQAAAAISKCKIFIGNDSGTMHLAATVGVPCVGIFSAIDYPGRWLPFGEKNTIFRRYVECEGCLLEVCPRNNECLNKISAEEVLQASLKMLGNL
jgi:ADP-heptose:LPS heptosyltransferase